jgi:pyruvate dehydrogenase E1 component
VEEGVIRGMYKYASKDAGAGSAHVQLFGSGAILREVLRAQDLLAEKYQVSSTAWSVTSYTELRRDAQAAERWNMLHPTEPPRHSYVETLLAKEKGPFIAASDYVRAVSEQIAPWVPGGMYVLGTDGFGRSELRAPLRRHFEVDAESITVATLYQLAKAGTVDQKTVAEAIKTLNIDPEKIDPLKA